IIMPQLGESIAEATILRVLVKIGDTIEADQDVFEVETNKATMNVSAPCPGRVDKLLVKLDESYAVGAVLAYLEVTADEVKRLGLDQPPVREQNGEAALSPEPKKPDAGNTRGVEPTVRGLPVPANAAGASYMS